MSPDLTRAARRRPKHQGFTGPADLPQRAISMGAGGTRHPVMPLPPCPIPDWVLAELDAHENDKPHDCVFEED